MLEYQYSDKWSYDTYNHFHSCKTCDEVKDLAPHEYCEYVVVKEPTKTANGKKVKTCKVCSQKHSEAIPRLG